MTIDNDSATSADVEVTTHIFVANASDQPAGGSVATIPAHQVTVAGTSSAIVRGSTTVANPRLWGPPPGQAPHLYVAVTQVSGATGLVDEVQTTFGIRELRFDPVDGLFVNGEPVYMQGVNQHHDLGTLGAAFNVRAAECQLEILRGWAATPSAWPTTRPPPNSSI